MLPAPVLERIGAPRIDAHINSDRSYQASLTRTVTRSLDRKEFRDNHETRLVSSLPPSASSLFPLRFISASLPCRDTEDNDAGIKLLASEPPPIQPLPVYESIDLHMQIARYK